MDKFVTKISRNAHQRQENKKTPQFKQMTIESLQVEFNSLSRLALTVLCNLPSICCCCCWCWCVCVCDAQQSSVSAHSRRPNILNTMADVTVLFIYSRFHSWSLLKIMPTGKMLLTLCRGGAGCEIFAVILKSTPNPSVHASLWMCSPQQTTPHNVRIFNG